MSEQRLLGYLYLWTDSTGEPRHHLANSGSDNVTILVKGSQGPAEYQGSAMRFWSWAKQHGLYIHTRQIQTNHLDRLLTQDHLFLGNTDD